MTKRIAEDPYIWLEDIESQKSMEWVKSHNQRTLEELQKDPRFEEIRSQTLAILSATDKIPMISFDTDYVYNFWTDQKNPRGLYRRTTYKDYKSANPHWEIVLDIDELGRQEGKSWVFHGCLKFFQKTSRCLIMLSDGGKDAHEIREFDLKSKSFVPGGFFVPLAKSTVAWLDLNSILVSTDFGPESLSESNYPREVRIMKRGQTLEQAQKIFEIPKKSMRAYVYNDFQDNDFQTLIVEDLDFYHHDYYLYQKQSLAKLEIPRTAELQGFFKGEIYFSLTNEYQGFKIGSLLKVKMGQWDRAEAVYVPTETSSFESVSFSKDDVYLGILENVNHRVYKLGANNQLIAFPPPSVGNSYLAAIDIFQNRAIFSFDNSVTPSTFYEWDGRADGKIQKIKESPARFDSKDLVVEQYFATSFDGTKIPYFVVRNKIRTGPQPTLMTAYGGFQISLYPFYDGTQGKVWLSQGGQYVIANIRGGGEYGPKWHEAALKQNRQVAYNDLFAVTEDLIKRGLTTQQQLALMGGSNGGLLAGVALTQRPDLFKAVLILVPLLDMLRYHKLSAGASWMGEYGNPDVDAERDYIQKYSPYQNLKPGKYPDVFLMTSTFDDRVHPGHARKFGARMEEFKIPFYYFENMEGGHAAAADLNQRARSTALIYSFLFAKLQTKPNPLP